MSQYDYTKTPCSIDRLTLEIQQSAIITALDHISLLGDSVSIFFKAALSSGDESVLNTIISAHDGTPLPENSTTNVKLVEDAVTPKDSDGSPLQRIKVTKTGWHYQLHGIEFETSVLNSLESNKSDNSPWNLCTMKFYELVNNIETEITGQNLTQTYLDSNCIKTVIDWEANFDIDIVGGWLKQKTSPTDYLNLWIVVAPDIPFQYGGSKEFISNLNLELMDKGVNIDGKTPKYISYDPVNHSGKFRLILRHSPGFKHGLHMIFELYKQ